jgi:hypothetical protein
MDDLAAMARLIHALRPWLEKLVIVGGWAHRLHRLSPLATPPRYQPVLTLDADVAFSLDETLEGNIAAALKAADFREQLSGEHTPPVSHYTLGEEKQGSMRSSSLRWPGAESGATGRRTPRSAARA